MPRVHFREGKSTSKDRLLYGHHRILKTGNSQAPAIKSMKPLVAGGFFTGNNK
jgi:hypothetical protein